MTEPPSFTARCLLRAARQATLATQSEGQPFASLVTPAVAPDGSILLLLSSLSAHTRHMMAEPRCALLVSGAQTGANPQTAPRITLTGRAQPEQNPVWRAYWLARHPYAAHYALFTDFSVWRLVPEAGHLIAGFAQAYTLSASDLTPPQAAVAAIAEAASRIIGHCNADHEKALSVLARHAGGSGAWRMSGVDPDGFDLVQDGLVQDGLVQDGLVQDGLVQDGLAEQGPMPETRVLRIAFDQPVCTGQDVRAALVRLLQAARVE